MSPLSDTSPEAERVLIEVHRRLTPQDKWRQLGELYQTARALHAAGVRLRQPDATDEEILDAWRCQALGAELAREVKEWASGRRHE